MKAPICYIDHSTGQSDHMNAHVQTAECFPYDVEKLLRAAESLKEITDVQLLGRVVGRILCAIILRLR